MSGGRAKSISKHSGIRLAGIRVIHFRGVLAAPMRKWAELVSLLGAGPPALLIMTKRPGFGQQIV
jgi:hypothetical protein